MKKEEKELLLKDLCARLPFKPMCEYTDIEDGCKAMAKLGYSLRDFVAGKVLIKPYLRPMSCMTEKEKVEIQDLYHQNTQEVFKDPSEIRGYRFYDISVVDWLNEHHFDYRGLIEKGLALEAPDDMYKPMK